MTLFLMLATASHLAAPTTYRWDPAQSQVYVQVFKADTLLSGLSHDHVVRATEMRGTLHWDPADPTTCKATVEVPVATLAVDEDTLRQRLGYPLNLSDSDKETVRRHMLAEDQLHADAHPLIRFQSDACLAGPKPGVIAASGQLTVRGQSKTFELRLSVTEESGGLRVKSSFEAVHRDFGFKPYSALLGTLKNAETLRFTLDAFATTKPSAGP